MKPIIIGITKDGKVDMTLDEFRKHMDDAYWQGRRDNTQSVTTFNGRWWETTPYYCGYTGNTTVSAATLNINKEG